MNVLKHRKVTKQEVLRHLAKHVACIYYGYIPLPKTDMAKELHTSLYQITKHINQLKKEGMVKLDHIDLNNTELEEFKTQLLVKGFTLTDKGKETPEYVEEYDKVQKWIREGLDKEK